MNMLLRSFLYFYNIQITQCRGKIFVKSFLKNYKSTSIFQNKQSYQRGVKTELISKLIKLSDINNEGTNEKQY